MAARFFRNYLAARGEEIQLTRKEALTFQMVVDAVADNIAKLKQDSIAGPSSKGPTHHPLREFRSSPKNGRHVTLQDRKIARFNFRPWSGLSRFARGFAEDFHNTRALYAGVGGSHITSEASFNLRWQDGRILVKGLITHTWTDDGYNFDPGQVFYKESRILERHHKAKPFKWAAVWADALEGELVSVERSQFEDLMEPSVLTWIRCKVSPAK